MAMAAAAGEAGAALKTVQVHVWPAHWPGSAGGWHDAPVARRLLADGTR